MTRDGAQGWDEYAPFYDWENARTVGRRDVPFWQQVVKRSTGAVLELGCGTGRVAVPLARGGARIVGVDLSEPMLARAAKRAAALARRAAGRSRRRLRLVRADIRQLPFEDNTFGTVLAPYGVLQSLTRERDLTATLTSVARIVRPGGLFGVDLVPDVPNWREYENRIQMRGKAAGGVHLTLVESVQQDRRRRLTTFHQTYIARRGGQVTRHAFDLTFRTLPLPAMTRRLENAGFSIEATLGDYRGGAWDERADVWVVLARRGL